MPGVPGGRGTELVSAFCCLITAASIGLYGRGRLNAERHWVGDEGEGIPFLSLSNLHRIIPNRPGH